MNAPARCRHLLKVKLRVKVLDMTAENRSRDGGNVWMIVLIALALIATVIMLFSDSAVWLQVALLAALWAAICGFLLVSRARNDRDRVRAELDAREREYQAELEALRARSDADRYALEAARAGEGLSPAVDVEVLREIRAELATLRAQLEDLSGREFGYEPAALQAEARRVKEIEARASRVAPAAESSTTATPSQPQEQPVTLAPHPEPQQAKSTPQPRPQQPGPQAQHQAPSEPARTPQQPQEPQQPGAHPRPEPVTQKNPFDQPRTEQTRPPTPAQPAPNPAQQPQRRASTRWGAPNSTEETSRITPVRDADEDQAINALMKQPQQPKQQEQRQSPAWPQAPKQQRPASEQQARPAEGSMRVHGAPSSDAVAGRVGTHRAPEGRNPLTDLIRERQEELERERAERERQQREAQERQQREARERAERERRQREEEARRAEAAAQEQESRGRRRADENRDGALTVAELLARSKKGQ